MGKLTKFTIRCLLYFNEQNILSLSNPTPAPHHPSLPPFLILPYPILFLGIFKIVKCSWCNMLPDQQYRIMINV